MIATREAAEAAYTTDMYDDAVGCLTNETEDETPDRLMDDRPGPSVAYFSDESFGAEAECAEDALFIKRLALIVIPAVVLICLLTQLLAYAH